MSYSPNPDRALREFGVRFERTDHFSEIEELIVGFTDQFSILCRSDYDFDLDRVKKWQHEVRVAFAEVAAISRELRKGGAVQAADRLDDALAGKFEAMPG